VNYPLKALYVVDGSTCSRHSNACCYGRGSNRRIVLYDALLQQTSETEVSGGLPSGWLLAGGDCSDFALAPPLLHPRVVAVVAHELGHWALRHELQSFALQQLYFLAVLYSWQWVCDAHAGALLSSFGFEGRAQTRPLAAADPVPDHGCGPGEPCSELRGECNLQASRASPVHLPAHHSGC